MCFWEHLQPLGLVCLLGADSALRHCGAFLQMVCVWVGKLRRQIFFSGLHLCRRLQSLWEQCELSAWSGSPVGDVCTKFYRNIKKEAICISLCRSLTEPHKHTLFSRSIVLYTPPEVSELSHSCHVTVQEEFLTPSPPSQLPSPCKGSRKNVLLLY